MNVPQLAYTVGQQRAFEGVSRSGTRSGKGRHMGAVLQGCILEDSGGDGRLQVNVVVELLVQVSR